jgi:hypothetical protein
MIDRKQVLPLHACVVVSALRAVSAILRTAAGLYRQQLAELHLSGLEMLSMHCLCLEQNVDQSGLVNSANFFAGPVVSHYGFLHP